MAQGWRNSARNVQSDRMAGPSTISRWLVCRFPAYNSPRDPVRAAAQRLACRVASLTLCHRRPPLALLATMDFSQMNAAEQAHMSKVIEKKQVRRRVCYAHVVRPDRCSAH